MTLGDLRKLSIRQQVQIRFRIREGMECVITEHGIAQVPGLKSVPTFNLEEELAGAAEFLVEPAAPPARKGEKRAPAPRRIAREELARMAAAAPGAGAHAEHEEE
jgi:hypothetical protein